jgi:hypothetical protein
MANDSEKTLQKTVSKQRQMLTTLLFDSVSELAKACVGKMNHRQALEGLLSVEMRKAEYCKYLWIADKTGHHLTPVEFWP